jgi:hypothetical protein
VRGREAVMLTVTSLTLGPLLDSTWTCTQSMGIAAQHNRHSALTSTSTHFLIGL